MSTSEHHTLQAELFKDSNVTVYDNHLVIHLYYFPFGDKTVEFRRIESITTGIQENLTPIGMPQPVDIALTRVQK